jgi:hypothetical protein
MSTKMIFNVYNGYTPLLKRTFLLLGSFFIMIDYSVRYFPDVIDTPVIGPFFKVRIFLLSCFYRHALIRSFTQIFTPIPKLND